MVTRYIEKHFFYYKDVTIQANPISRVFTVFPYTDDDIRFLQHLQRFFYLNIKLSQITIFFLLQNFNVK